MKRQTVNSDDAMVIRQVNGEHKPVWFLGNRDLTVVYVMTDGNKIYLIKSPELKQAYQYIGISHEIKLKTLFDQDIKCFVQPECQEYELFPEMFEGIAA